MDAFDEVVRSEVRRVVDKFDPAADLWLRVQQGLTRKQSGARSGFAIVAVAAAVLAITIVFPGPRALATDFVRLVFKLGGVEYTVSSGMPTTVRAPAASEVKVGRGVSAVTATQNHVRQFRGVPGRFPDEARDTIKGLQYPFRVPGWIPADLPVQVYISAEPADTGANVVSIVLGDQAGNAIFISQLAPAPEALSILTGSSDSTAKDIALGTIRAVETRTAETVAYHFNVNGVQIDVSGPVHYADEVRRVAESLVG